MIGVLRGPGQHAAPHGLELLSLVGIRWLWSVGSYTCRRTVRWPRGWRRRFA